MAPRRSTPNSLSPQDPNASPAGPGPSARSSSPSSNFTQFLTRPAKWFGRSTSASKLPPGTAEPRSSTSSGRKHKISRPTDPRPILDSYGAGTASKSVLDLSTRPPGSLETPPFHPPSTPSSPITAPNPSGLGDLRGVSRRGWSKSVDDLGKAAGMAGVGAGGFTTPIDTSFRDRVAEYRNRSDSSASAAGMSSLSPSSPASTASITMSFNHNAGRHPFPTLPSDSPSSSPPRSATLPSVSISAPPTPDDASSTSSAHTSPMHHFQHHPHAYPHHPVISSPTTVTGTGAGAGRVPTTSASSSSSTTHVHTRSHSFTPKLSSKLATTPRFMPPSPGRKGSLPSEADSHGHGHGHGHGHNQPAASPRGFGFGFGGLTGSSKSLSSSGSGSGGGERGNNGAGPKGDEPSSTHSQSPSTSQSGGFLAPPPTIIEPGGGGGGGDASPTSPSDLSHGHGHAHGLGLGLGMLEDDGAPTSSKRSSQIVYHSGFINRLDQFHHATNSLGYGYGHATASLAKGWKPFKMELKGTKLFFFKPPGDRSGAVKELFPSGLVPPSAQDEDGEGEGAGERESGGRKGGSDAGGGRKKRAFWGRRTHPDLVEVEGRIERGTFEALIHEAVFGTTFKPVVDVGLESQVQEGEEEEGDGAVTPRGGDDESHASVKHLNEAKLQAELRWKEFAGSILLCLPSIIGQQKFELEFLRCCDYLVSGAAAETGEDGSNGEDSKARQKERVEWLAREYLKFHGKPADLDGWEQWRVECIPEVEDLDAESILARLEGRHQGEGSEGSTEQSSASRATTPAAGDGKLLSLIEALKPTPDMLPSASPNSAHHPHQQQQQQYHPNRAGYGQPKHHATHSHSVWTALEQEGLSRDVLVALDPHLVAESLTAFHRHVLGFEYELDEEDVTLESVLGDEQHHQSGGEKGTGPGVSSFSLLFGSDEQPHWLTKLVLLQIFSSGGAAAPVGGPGVGVGVGAGGGEPGHMHHNHGSLSSRKSEDKLSAMSNPNARSPSPSPSTTLSIGAGGSAAGAHPHGQGVTITTRTQTRSELISIWIKIAELCRVNGDECAWKAIVMGLCSRPVARLDKVWKRVDHIALAALESWVSPPSLARASGGGVSVSVGGTLGAGVQEPKVVPWGGDVSNVLKRLFMQARVEGESANDQGMVLLVEPLEEARKLFDAFRSEIIRSRRGRTEDEEGGGEESGDGKIEHAPEDMERLMEFWSRMAENGGGVGGFAARFQRVDQFMSLSMAAEPRRKGLFEPYYWTKSSSNHAPYSSLIPLLFPEPLPSISLIDRGQLLRGRVDSDSSDIQIIRGIDGQARRHLDRLGDNTATGPSGSMTAADVLGSLSRIGTVIPVFNGELLLVVQPTGMESTPSSRPSSSRAPSRPPSSAMDSDFSKPPARNPSIRVKPGASHGLDRKTSIARRSSLPSVSNRQNFVVAEPTSEPPLRVLVQAGTLNKLVDILVFGLKGVSVSVADDNGEMTLSKGMTRELVVDHGEFSNVWWNVFRSFMTPMIFFELLRKLYINSHPHGPNPSVADYHEVINRRSEVLATLKEWITVGGGAQDILDDPALFDVVRSFLFESSSNHTIIQSKNFEEASVRQFWSSVTHQRETLGALFVASTMRPPIARAVPRTRNSMGSVRMMMMIGNNRDPPDIDHIDPEELVDHIDCMASAAFSNVTEEDLFATADLLEVQTADRTGWFSLREAGTTEEAVEIQTIYSHIQEVEPSSLISELSQDILYRLLPPSVRSCIRAFGILRKWLIATIVAPKLGIRTRQTRIELLLKAIEVARMRNVDVSSSLRMTDTPCVRSFVETVITSALVSIESRLHQKAWQNVALGRGVQCDLLSTLLARPTISTLQARNALTVDMGWLIERMLEVIATPDIIDSIAFEGQALVNFDKRRHLCGLVTKGPHLPSKRRVVHPEDHIRRGFDRLNQVENEVTCIQFDYRGIKDEASREAAVSGSSVPASSKKLARPFQRLVITQMEKNRRDRHLRSRLQKEKIHEQAKNEKRDDMLARAMRPRKPAVHAQKQHRNKKSMSAFLNFMRPISSAFGADITPSSHKRSASELDFKPTGKPSLVLSLMEARVAQFINNERSFTFQLDTEDGGHYLLQAMNKKDMQKWINTINRVTKMAAKRRLTYLGNSPKPQLADHLHDHPSTASRDPKAVFGVELDFLLQREAGGSEVPPGTIPRIIEQCLAEVESRGLTEVGIYRIAGATSEIQGLKDAFNRGEFPIRSDTDIHAICDVVKSWFRVLPEPVFPSSSYHEVIQAMQLENLDERLARIRSVVQGLPQGRFDLLKRVSEHLDRVTDFEEHNHMTAEALAIVFSPNLLRAPRNDFALILANMGHTHKLVKALITHFHTIFDDADPEVDAQSEDEFDSTPIPEEDEEEEDELAGRSSGQYDGHYDDYQQAAMPQDQPQNQTP
ncbi:hypothetical protein AX16_002876 [Volvariella volvacea WC 439]|nr:hypothetical protein AX16_002876 [Volvariella volvacea WC 439]